MKSTWLIISFSLALFSCKFSKDEYCNDYLQLAGQYKHVVNEGVVTWTGELTGTVDFSGVDYNEMTCTYQITDCESGTILMNCEGADFPTTIIINEDQSIMLNSSIYKKL